MKSEEYKAKNYTTFFHEKATRKDVIHRQAAAADDDGVRREALERW